MNKTYSIVLQPCSWQDVEYVMHHKRIYAENSIYM